MTTGSPITTESAPEQDRGPHLAYRPEIDGLRAIAVLSVVLYHFGVPGLGGGFVGVDVFFVLSGFLIGGLLWQELGQTGRIALGRFYLRRIRRLAPAFFAMATVTTLAAAWILLPFEFREYGKELIASTVWLSNLLFWQGAGYFDPGADSRVLLHTWSLSVEEQFYIVLPVTLLLLRPFRRGLPGVLAALWLLSLAGSLWILPRDPEGAFYLFPFRAWELLTGVLLAIRMAERPLAPPRWVAPAGLVLVLASIVLVRAEGFPGWQVLAPVLGTAMLLAVTDRGDPVLRVLSWRAPVFVGLISYSLYLWHWPVLILARYWRGEGAGWIEVSAWLALSVLLAVLCWALIERPVRRSGRVGTRALLGGSMLAGAAMLAAGAFAYLSDGWAGRFGPAARVHIAASQDFLQDWSRCHTPDDGAFADLWICPIGPEDAPPTVLFWGDSHLRALMDGLALAAEEEGAAGLILWHAGCPPLFGLAKTETAATPAEDAACPETTARIRAALEAAPGIERVMLVARWSYYVEGTGTGADAVNQIALRPAPGSGLGGETQAELFGTALGATVARLNAMGREVHVLRQVPEIADYGSRSVARGLIYGRLSEADALTLGYAHPEALTVRVARAESVIAALAAAGRIVFVDPWPILCPERCAAVHGGVGYYFDNNHLTNAGALAIRDLFRPFLAGRAP